VAAGSSTHFAEEGCLRGGVLYLDRSKNSGPSCVLGIAAMLSPFVSVWTRGLELMMIRQSACILRVFVPVWTGTVRPLGDAHGPCNETALFMVITVMNGSSRSSSTYARSSCRFYLQYAVLSSALQVAPAARRQAVCANGRRPSALMPAHCPSCSRKGTTDRRFDLQYAVL
jgi:hypothetical protein